MFGLDDLIASLGGASVLLALLASLLLGLRHATDPDHLTAVSTLVMSDERHGSKRAAKLGLAWGTGHALSLLLLGLPIVLFNRYLPERLQQAAEVAIGLVIIGLAVRLLLRWRRGYFHAHEHSHGEKRHIHPHVHEGAHGTHTHAHKEALGRSPLAAFGIGIVHGVGGSAGAGILLVSAVPGRVAALVALVVFAAGTALSMAALSWGFGHALARGPVLKPIRVAIPAFGVAGVLFGVWYALGAVGTVPYVF